MKDSHLHFFSQKAFWFPSLRSIGAVVLVLLGLSFFSIHTNAVVGPPEKVVAPNVYATSEAETANAAFGSSGTRFQVAYNPSEFVDILPLGGFIDQIAFRMDGRDRTDFIGTIENLEIRMSTFPGLSSQLSLRFSENIAGGQTLVLPPQRLIFDVHGAASGVNPFDLIIPLKTPYSYNPAMGSLLLDVFVRGGEIAHTLALDAETGSVHSRFIIGIIDNNLAHGGRPAPVIELQYQAVPEPTAWVLLLLGTTVLFMLQRNHNERDLHCPSK